MKSTLISFSLITVINYKVTATSFVNSRKVSCPNFGKRTENAMLNVSILTAFPAELEVQCMGQCILHDQCFSYNFVPEDHGFRCELSGMDRFSGRDNFLSKSGSIHRGLVTVCDQHSTCGDKGFCIPVYEADAARCDCLPGYIGVPCEPKSCAQILKESRVASGVYTVNPDGQQSFPVYCDMVTDGGGWTVLQRRQDGSVSFYRDWDEYKRGFGDNSGEFWLGNDKIHRLTASQEMVLRFDLEDFEGSKTYAIYQDMNVLSESKKYLLSFGAYSGTAGDSLTEWHNGQVFSTIDRDNDPFVDFHCAEKFKGGWWYRKCHKVNINGLYLRGNTSSFGTGINWLLFRGYYYSLKKTEMKIRPKS